MFKKKKNQSENVDFTMIIEPAEFISLRLDG